MTTHRTHRTFAIATIVLITLIVLTCVPLSAPAQRDNKRVPAGITVSLPRSSMDIDGFKSFDALTMAAQAKLLRENGPRMEQQQEMNDFSFRGFVWGGGKFSVDYQLGRDAIAELTIDVPGFEPLVVKLEPTPRDRTQFKIPEKVGSEPLVARFHIVALTNNKEPANFEFYGIQIQEKETNGQERRKTIGVNSDVQLAANQYAPALKTPAVRRFTASSPQIGPAIQINVNPPTTIKAGGKPPMSFSFTSQSNFSNGRWEVWRAKGLNLTQVWQKKTGVISPNQTNSGTWDGTDRTKEESLGTHCLQLSAWHGRESDNHWVLARTKPSLIVIK